MNLQSIENLPDNAKVNVNAIDLRRLGLKGMVAEDTPNYRPCKIQVGKLRGPLEQKAQRDAEAAEQRKTEAAAEVQQEFEKIESDSTEDE